MIQSQASEISIVYIFRNRDPMRVRRSLDSLTRQSDQNFNIIFVDYGSDEPLKSEIQELVCSYPRVKYVHALTQGQPWNRSHAINIGIKIAQTEFIFTADIDMIFRSDFVSKIHELTTELCAVYFAAYYLPESFSDWEHIDSVRYSKSKDYALGWALLPNSKVKELGGYDEFYSFWGQEDNDMESRLKSAGVKTIYFDQDILMFHQWHPLSTSLKQEYPEGWGIFQLNYMDYHKDSIIRNRENEWGKPITAQDRPALQKFNSGNLIFEVIPYGYNFFAFHLASTFMHCKSGEHIALQFVDTLSQVHAHSNLGKMIAGMQWIIKILRMPFEVWSKYRHLYSTVYQVRHQTMLFILSHRPLISDYFFQMDEKNFKIIIFKK